ncbi:MAG: hypothetical protein MJZ61_04340 [Bacteroidales bacterium]|nr:hypothetical protein [Bacteroidales bacterium]
MKNFDTEELLKELKDTKKVIDQLIEGVNPSTGKNVSPREVIFEYNVSRKLEFLSEYLNGEISKYEDSYQQNSASSDDTLSEYEISTKESQKYVVSEEPITMAEICNKLNALRGSSKMRKLKGISAIEVLTAYGYINRERRKVIPTDLGISLGIKIMEFTSNGNTMTRVVYGQDAQRFIIDHIKEIIEINKTKRF